MIKSKNSPVCHNRGVSAISAHIILLFFLIPTVPFL